MYLAELILALIAGVIIWMLDMAGARAGVSPSPAEKTGSAERRGQPNDSSLILVKDTIYLTEKHLGWMCGFNPVEPSKIPPGNAMRRRGWVFGLGKSTRPAETIMAKAKSRLDCSEIDDKVKFHEHAQANPTWAKQVAKTVEIHSSSLVVLEEMLASGELFPGPWMMRANWGWKGAASGVAESLSQLSAWYERLSVRPENLPGRFRGVPRVIASEYIQDPMLNRGLKFHARVHIIVVVLGRVNAKRYAVMPNTLEIISAGKPWVAGNWADEDIHDTHEARNPSVQGILDDQPRGKDLRSATITAMTALFGGANSMLDLVKLYPESDYAADLLGVDVMYRQDGSAVVLEVNNRPGIAGEPDTMHNIRDELILSFIRTIGVDVFGQEPFSAEALGAPEPFVRLS